MNIYSIVTIHAHLLWPIHVRLSTVGRAGSVAGGATIRVVLNEPKMALVVRTDLGMGKGKIAAQVAHAAVAAALRERGTAAFAAWSRAGQPKVVLKIGSETELAQLCAQAHAAGLPVQVIHDAGRTQIVAGTMTCCAIGPAYGDDVDRVTAPLSLL